MVKQIENSKIAILEDTKTAKELADEEIQRIADGAAGKARSPKKSTTRIT